MPRKSLDIKKFDGGINSNSDLKDLGDNEFSVLQDCNVSHKGKVISMGGSALGTDTDGNTILDVTTENMTPGYGLFTFNTDVSAGIPEVSTSGILDVNITQLGVVEEDSTCNIYMEEKHPSFISNRASDSQDLGYDPNDCFWDSQHSQAFGGLQGQTLNIKVASTHTSVTNQNVTVASGATRSTVRAALSTAVTALKSSISSTHTETDGVHIVSCTCDEAITNDITLTYWTNYSSGGGGSWSNKVEQYDTGFDTSWGYGYTSNPNHLAQIRKPFSIDSWTTFVQGANHTVTITCTAPSSGTHYYKVNILGTEYPIGDGGSGSSNTDTSNNDLASEVKRCLTNVDSAGPTSLKVAAYSSSDEVAHNSTDPGINVSVSGNVVTLISLGTAGPATAFDVNAYNTAAPVAIIRDEHIAFMDNTGDVYFHHKNIQSWEKLLDFDASTVATTAELGTQTLTGAEGSFYVAEGGVRYCDSNFATAATLRQSQFYGYFPHKWAGLDRRGWHYSSLMPTYDEVENYFGVIDGTSTAGTPSDSDDVKFRLNLTGYNNTDGGADFPFENGAAYTFWGAVVIDNNQQSDIVDLGLEITLTAPDGSSENAFRIQSNNGLKIYMHDNLANPNNAEYRAPAFHPRTTGFRIYWASKGSGNNPKYLLFEVDLKSKKLIMSDGTPIDLDLDSGILHNDNPINFTTQDETNESSAMSGIDFHINDLIYLKGWKTSVVINNRVFLGNVQYTTNQDGVSNPVVYGDRVLVSPVGKYDTFADSVSVLDIGVRDGEDIVKLETYGGKLLQFKQNTLYIIEVSDKDAENVTDTYKLKGVSSPNHVCWTDDGIVWVNKFGCYTYDGSEIKNVLEGEDEDSGLRISFSDWRSFITDNAIIGYDGVEDNLIVKRHCSTSIANGGDVYVYNFKVNAWTFGKARYTQSSDGNSVYNNTNFITRSDGTLLLMKSVSTSQYNKPASQSGGS